MTWSRPSPRAKPKFSSEAAKSNNLAGTLLQVTAALAAWLGFRVMARAWPALACSAGWFLCYESCLGGLGAGVSGY